MQPAIKPKILITAIGALFALFLVLAMNLLMVSGTQATPQLAKGKPCGTCHEGSPPSKSNVKK